MVLPILSFYRKTRRENPSICHSRNSLSKEILLLRTTSLTGLFDKQSNMLKRKFILSVIYFHYTYFQTTFSLFSFAQNNWRVSQQGAEACGTAGWWESHRVAVSHSRLVMHYVSLRATSGVSIVQLTHCRYHNNRGSCGDYF